VPEALRLFTRAAVVDSAWPMPRLASAIMHANLEQADEAAVFLQSLRPVRERLPLFEAATFDMTEALLRGNLPGAYDAAVQQARLAPGSIGHYMVAETARRLGRPLEALAVLDELDPERGELRGWRAYWRERTYALHLLGRFPEEVDAARRAISLYPNDFFPHSYLLRALAAAGDTGALDAAFGAYDAVTGSVALRAEVRALTVVHLTRHHPARRAPVQQRVLARFANLPPGDRDGAVVRLSEARVLLLAGRPDDAAERVAPLLAGPLEPIPTVSLGRLGVIAAATGQRALAEQIATQLADRARALSAPARGLAAGEHAFWRAAIAAQLGDRDEALERLRQARREGLSTDPRLVSEPAFDALREWPPMASLLRGPA
jgi:tetratricopeptide (TPR) repeat protein